MTAKPKLPLDEARLDAASVYRDGSAADCWLVDAPASEPEAVEAFSGPDACRNALEFAYRRYGSARFFAN